MPTTYSRSVSRWLLLELLFVSLLSACPSSGAVPNDAEKLIQHASLPDLSELEALLGERSADEALAQIATWRGMADVEAERILDLYQGRSLRLSGQASDALRFFESAAQADNAETARAARLYLALSWAEAGRETQAFELLMRHLDEPGSGVGVQELASLWTLVGEARYTAADRLGALLAFGQAHSTANSTSQADAADYALLRALAVASQLDENELALEADTWPAASRAAFLDAAARQAVARGEREQARAQVEQASEALRAVGELLRAAELIQLSQLEGAPNEHVLIGVILPLSGESRRMGRALMAGILQAQGAFAPSSGQRMSFLFEDSRGDPEVARAAVASLDERGALAILGPLNASESKAAAEEASLRNMLLLSFSLERASDAATVFRFAPSLENEVDALAQAAWEHGLRRVLILASESNLSLTLSDRFASAFTTRGGELAGVETFAAGTVDHRSLASELSKLQFDAVFMPTSLDDAVRLSSFLAQENIWSRGPADVVDSRDKRRFVVYLGTSLWPADEVVDKASRNLEGACFAVSYASQLGHDANVAFVSAFRSLYDRDPGTYEAIAFDTTRLLRELVLFGGASERSTLAARFAELSDFEGATGRMLFVERNAAPQPTVLQLQSNALQALAPVVVPGLVPADASFLQ